MTLSAEDVLAILKKRHERLRKKMIGTPGACEIGALMESESIIKRIEREINKARKAYSQSCGVIIDNFADIDD